jgi:glucokinase
MIRRDADAEGQGPEMSDAKLIADIGGTNARFALARGGTIEGLKVLPTHGYKTLADAARAYLAEMPDAASVKRGAFDMAGPVVGGHAQLTNGGWAFVIEELRRELGFDDLKVVNDFAAAALGIPHLEPSDVIQIGAGTREEFGPIGVVGPGTGLGVGGLVHSAQGWVVIPGEGGHVTMGAASEEEARLLAILRGKFGHVSAERVLSGQGIENLYDAVREEAGRPGPHRPASEITPAALSGADADASRALDIFCAMLGTIAGNLALTLGATGGVYLIGGILPRFPDRFAASGFRARFEDKGRLAPYLRPIPTYLVTHENPALPGLAGMQ